MYCILFDFRCIILSIATFPSLYFIQSIILLVCSFSINTLNIFALESFQFNHLHTLFDIYVTISKISIEHFNKGTIVSIKSASDDKLLLKVYDDKKIFKYDAPMPASVFNACCIPVKTVGRVKS